MLDTRSAEFANRDLEGKPTAPDPPPAPPSRRSPPSTEPLVFRGRETTQQLSFVSYQRAPVYVMRAHRKVRDVHTEFAEAFFRQRNAYGTALR